MTNTRHRKRVAAATLSLFTDADAPAAAASPPAPVPHAVETPPPRPSDAAEAVAIREALGLCPRLFSRLPAASTLVCDGAAGRVVFTTSAATYAGNALTVSVFTGTELAAVALAAEHDRGSPAALMEWCTRKQHHGPAWRLTAAAALGPVSGRFEPLGWTIGRVLSRLGLTLAYVHVHDAGEALLFTDVMGGTYASTE